MEENVPAAAQPDPAPSGSFLSRVAGVFWSPAAAFAGIARKPDFISPLILLIASSVAVAETMMAKIGMERIIRLSMEQSGQASKMSPDQIQQAIQRGAAIGRIFTHIAAVIGVPLFLLVVAGFGLLVLNGIFGSQTGFRRVFSATCYAYMPSLLGALMALAVIFFGDPEHFNPRSPVPSNPGFFLDPQSTPPALRALAGSLDIFTLWFLILLSIGLSAAAGRRVRQRSIFLIFLGVWILLTLAKVGFAMIVA